MARNAFVLGGGGILGAAEVGMAQALIDEGVVPDLICGTSIGAINGAALAADPTPRGVKELLATWEEMAAHDVLGGSMFGRVVTLVRSGTALHGNGNLRALLTEHLPVHTFEELAVPFECVAASIEGAREHWFGSGDLIEAVLASCALPGVFPPVHIGDEHYLDGGLVNSIPLGRAVQGGADTVWVLHVGRVEQQLTVPRYPWEVGFVAFEIARRHRFHTDLRSVPDGVTVHLLPTGHTAGRPATWENLRYRDGKRIGKRAEQAYHATLDYLAALR